MNGTDRILLRAYFPSLADRLDAEGLAESNEGETLALETAATGEPTLTAAGVHAHSIRDPRREARKLAEASRGDGPLVILGFGLGYLAEAAIELDPRRALVVVEREAAALALAFRARDLSPIIAREGTAFVVGGPPEGVLAALEAFGGVPQIASNRALRALDEAWYRAVEDAVHGWKAKDEINAATLKRFGKRWVRNLTANLDSIRDLPGISLLAGRCSGLPALIVAAGPSLDEILPSLRALSQRCIIIAVDTALRALATTGTEADFVLVVDPQFWNARHLDRCPSPRSALVTESAAYPSVLRAVREGTFGRAFLCSSVFPLGRFVEDRVDAKGVLGAGGSVATTAWDFARVLGAFPLWMAGLDLSFPELKTHFKGALFEERSHGESRRFDPVELRSFRALRDGRPFRAASASGGSVLTDRRLSLYASWFESRFRRNEEFRPRSLSARGLRIAGMETCAVEELLALPPRRAEIDGRLSLAFTEIEAAFSSAGAGSIRETRYGAALAELEKGLGEILSTARRATAECRTATAALGAADGGPGGGRLEMERIASSALAVLDAADKAVSASDVKDVAGFLFPPLAALEAELGEGGGDPLRRHLQLSGLLYERLAESAEYHLSTLISRTRKR